MCTLAAVVGSVAPVVQGISGMQSANAQAKAAMEEARYTAGVNERNAFLADFDADATVKQGSKQESLMRQQGRSVLASQNVGYGASNVVGATPEQVARDSRLQVELDAAALRGDYAVKAGSLRNQAVNYRAGAQNALIAGRNRSNALKASGDAALAGGLLSGFGTAAAKWDDLSYKGSVGGSGSSANEALGSNMGFWSGHTDDFTKKYFGDNYAGWYPLQNKKIG